ncbi:double zinc ribbon domain-containing protein (plasmid) [Microbulbifer sp. SSSA002]|uniref:double zinc ribbon domain-containing protein n=1 Tax=Microbulbifer sp. SSSA002 TaxID=3243376 RepID=UPI004039E2D6
MESTESDFGLCGSCRRDTPFIGGVVCESCGTPLPGDTDDHRIECDDCMDVPRPWRDGRAALLYEGKARSLVLALSTGIGRSWLDPLRVGWRMQGAKLLRQICSLHLYRSIGRG